VTRLIMRSRPDAGHLATLAHGLIVAALIVVLLIAGREILEPLVIAALLAFILSPFIRRLRQWGVWRIPSVILAVLFALGVIGALSTIIALQITQLAQDLPTYETNLRNKIRDLGAGKLTSGALDRASGTLRDLQEEITKAGPATPAGQKPMVVEVRQPEPRGLESIAALVRPLLSPLAMTALVVLFLIFILLQREDIRDRFLRLAGTSDLQRSTAALDDAGSRLSRFFLLQTLLNAGFGVFIAIGLWVIGVPNPMLWGIFAGLMRFVPFIGGLIAAFFPIALAAAVDPGWTMALAVAGLFLISEPIAGHVVEPLLYGQHTGLSPVAIVISTLFWTLVWGPIGLLLATPLTVCLVVLGRHIEALQFIEVLLGDEPALEPHERFYQRLLAGDDTEAADMAESQLKKQSLSGYYDAVAMPALALAQTDAARGKLSHDKQMEIYDTVEDVVEDLSEYDDHDPTDEDGARAATPSIERADLRGKWDVDHPILCVASRSPLDQAACAIFTQLLDKHGLPARVQSFADVASARSFKIDAADAPLVCLSYFGSAGNPAHVRYLIKRLRRVMPNARFLAGFWLLLGKDARAEEWRAAVGADLVATSLTQALDICVNEARADFEHTKVLLGPDIGKKQMLVDRPAQQAKGKAQQKVGEAKSMIKDR
jgi:predicted PurR-regulated permease PerM